MMRNAAQHAKWTALKPSMGVGKNRSLPAVEPGILPGGMGVSSEKSFPLRTSGSGGKMPPSTAAKMAAATDVNPTLNTYSGSGGRFPRR